MLNVAFFVWSRLLLRRRASFLKLSVQSTLLNLLITPYLQLHPATLRGLPRYLPRPAATGASATTCSVRGTTFIIILFCSCSWLL